MPIDHALCMGEHAEVQPAGACAASMFGILNDIRHRAAGVAALAWRSPGFGDGGTRMSRTYNVIDADGHILEPLDLWAKYMDRKFRDRAPRLVPDNETGKEKPLVEQQILGV